MLSFCSRRNCSIPKARRQRRLPSLFNNWRRLWLKQKIRTFISCKQDIMQRFSSIIARASSWPSGGPKGRPEPRTRYRARVQYTRVSSWSLTFRGVSQQSYTYLVKLWLREAGLLHFVDECPAWRDRQTLPVSWWSRVLHCGNPAVSAARGTYGAQPACLEYDHGGGADRSQTVGWTLCDFARISTKLTSCDATYPSRGNACMYTGAGWNHVVRRCRRTMMTQDERRALTGK